MMDHKRILVLGGLIAISVFLHLVWHSEATLTYKMVAGVLFRQHPENSSNVEYLLQQSRTGYWVPPKARAGLSQPKIRAIVKALQAELGLKPEDLKVHDGFEKTIEYTAFGEIRNSTNYLIELLNNQFDAQTINRTKLHQWFKYDSNPKSWLCYTETQKLLSDAEQFLKEIFERKEPAVEAKGHHQNQTSAVTAAGTAAGTSAGVTVTDTPASTAANGKANSKTRKSSAAKTTTVADEEHNTDFMF